MTRRWSFDKFSVALGIVVLVMIIALVIGSFYAYNNKIDEDEKLSSIYGEIADAGIQIRNATFESPAIIIELNDITELIGKVEELGQSEIYSVAGYGWVVLDKEGTYAWNYEFDFDNFTPIGIIIASIMILTLVGPIFFWYVTFDAEEYERHHQYHGG